MYIVFQSDGNLSIGMREFVREAILVFGEDVLRPAVTSARKNVFDIGKNAVRIT
jgi:hypothetical protein